MTRDEVKKLLGGYATGSLTESERALLFEAALEDQDLFDELAGEQALKELLESPGAKDRLLAGLRPADAKQVWWTRPWPWATAAGLSIAAAVVWVMMPRAQTPEFPLEVAQTKAPVAESAPAPVATPVAPKATASRQGQQGRSAPVAPEARTEALKDVGAVAPGLVVAPAPPPPQPGPPAVAQLAQDARRQDAVTVTAETSLLKTESGDAVKSVTPRLPVLPLGGAAKGGGGAKGGFAAGALESRSNLVINGQPSNTQAIRNAFTYAVTAQGTLRVVPLQNGVLEVTAAGVAQPLFPRNPVVSGTVIEVAVPRQAQGLQIDFGSAGTTLPATERSTELSGTVMLPGNERIVRVIPAR